MTNKKNIELTPEEQAELEQNLPLLLEAIAKGSAVAPAWLASWRSKRNVSEEAKEQAQKIQNEVATAIKSAPPEQTSLAQWCGFPTDMTRCSPFFPMNVKELGHREFLQDFLITSANWGEIRYTGPKLSTYDEDVLMCLLAMLDKTSKHRYISEIEGEKTYTYRGPASPLLRLLGYARAGKDAYKRLISSLKRMTVAGVELSISTGKTKSGKRRAPRITQMSAMLSAVYWNDETKELTATINPFFYETYIAGRITLMDTVKRLSLKGVISKALYRFIQSQREGIFTGHFLTLADALNMDREQPARETRRKLKTAITELIRQGALTKKSRFLDSDIVRLERAPDALPSKNEKSPQSLG